MSALGRSSSRRTSTCSIGDATGSILKPGITGLWQVLGRDDIPFEEMVRLDYVYVTTWSLLNDLKLILRTLPAVLRTRASY